MGARATTSSTTSTPSSISSTSTSSGGKSYMPDGNWGPGASSASPAAPAMAAPVAAFKAPMSVAPSAPAASSSASSSPSSLMSYWPPTWGGAPSKVDESFAFDQFFYISVFPQFCEFVSSCCISFFYLYFESHAIPSNICFVICLRPQMRCQQDRRQ